MLFEPAGNSDQIIFWSNFEVLKTFLKQFEASFETSLKHYEASFETIWWTNSSSGKVSMHICHLCQNLIWLEIWRKKKHRKFRKYFMHNLYSFWIDQPSLAGVCYVQLDTKRNQLSVILSMKMTSYIGL